MKTGRKRARVGGKTGRGRILSKILIKLKFIIIEIRDEDVPLLKRKLSRENAGYKFIGVEIIPWFYTDSPDVKFKNEW